MSKCFFVQYFSRSGSFLGIILQRNALGCVTFQFVDNLCIHLCCGKVTVGKQLAHGVDVRSSCQLQGRECMTEAVVVKPKINGRQTRADRNVKR